MPPGTVRNHQPWTPGMLGTGPGSVNTSARVNARAARKSACLLVGGRCAMCAPIVVGDPTSALRSPPGSEQLHVLRDALQPPRARKRPLEPLVVADRLSGGLRHQYRP